MPELSPETSGLITAAATVVAAMLAYLSVRVALSKRELERQIEQLDERRVQLERKIEQLGERRVQLEGRVTELETWSATVSTSFNEDVNVIVLGPRNSGKSSLVRLWCQPWADVRRQTPTESWEDYHRPVLEYSDGTFLDEKLKVTRVRKRLLRYHIRDYAGEDRYRFEALKYFGHLDGDAILMLCIATTDPASPAGDAARAASYYSAAFLKECRECIAKFNGRLTVVPVVFTKVDLLDPNEGLGVNDLQERLANIHVDTINNVRAIFGGKEHLYCTSAVTNREVLNLLRDMTLEFVSDEGKRKLANHSWV